MIDPGWQHGGYQVGEATSTFTIRDLIDAMKHLEPRQTAMLRGRHGIGKSQVAYEMAEKWGLKKVIERRISQLSEGDMIGLPDRGAVRVFDGQEWKVTKFLPTDWFLEAEFEPCLVFLDEINRGTPEVMQACFQFVEKGELNGRRIHPESRLIAAVNHSKEYHVTPMDPAFVNRFWVADVEPDKEDWLTWARGKGNIHPDIIDFIIQCNEEHFEVMPEKLAQMNPSDVTPSRRSWERLNRHLVAERDGTCLLEMPATGVFYNVCRGFVGPDASRALSKFVQDRSQNISPEDIINDFPKFADRVKRMKPEAQVALIDKLGHYLTSKNVKLTDEQGKNTGAFMKALPAEIGVTIWNAVAGSSVDNAAVLHKYVAKYFLRVLASTKLGEQIKALREAK